MEPADACNIVLAAPWLSRAAPAWFDHAGVIPSAPALERLLAKADRHASPIAGAAAQAACRFFELPVSDPAVLPWAALAHAGETERPEPGCWLRIDPVHLRPDMARLLLFAYPDITLGDTEAQALAATVGECLADWGELSVVHPSRWYLRLNDPTPLATTSPDLLAGEDIRGAMPGGEAGRQWRTLINETQMLLFEHPVNQQREAQGLLPVNSIWPWGWGQTPLVPEAGYDRVTANSALVRGLARLSGIREVGDADGWEGCPLPGVHLIWLEPLTSRAVSDPDGWGDWLGELEAHWFAPLVQALLDKQLDSVVLHTGAGQAWHVTPQALRRFWRRRQPLPRLLQLNTGSAQ